MKNYVATNKATLFPIGIAGAAISTIMAVALMLSEVSPTFIF